MLQITDGLGYLSSSLQEVEEWTGEYSHQLSHMKRYVDQIRADTANLEVGLECAVFCALVMRGIPSKVKIDIFCAGADAKS